MKRIFIVTGEPSGDKLASKVISKLQKNKPNVEYSCVGGTHLNSLGIKSIFDLKEITYIGFTSVLFNIFVRNNFNIFNICIIYFFTYQISIFICCMKNKNEIIKLCIHHIYKVN